MDTEKCDGCGEQCESDYIRACPACFDGAWCYDCIGANGRAQCDRCDERDRNAADDWARFRRLLGLCDA